MAEETRHEALPLRTVSRLTGLSADIIRAWERRYGVVAPVRGPRGARLYSDADVAQLRLLRRAVASGRAIGDVARLSRGALADLVDGDAPAGRGSSAAPSASPTPAAAEWLARATQALERFDQTALERCLGDGMLSLGIRGFVQQVAAPLMADVGERWHDGRLSVSDEHLVSGLLRNLLAGVLRLRGGAGQPAVLLATPSGERHELGLLLAGLMIAEAGCGLCYLGLELPAVEVVSAARRAGTAVVGLGITNGADLDAVAAEVRRVERGLPPTTELWLGGRAAGAVAAHLGATRAVVVDQVLRLESEVARVRAQRGARA